MSEADDLRKCLADIVLAGVMHPEWPEQFEVVGRSQMDQARMMLERSDINAAASRARRRIPHGITKPQKGQ